MEDEKDVVAQEKKAVPSTLTIGQAHGGLMPSSFEGLWQLSTIMAASGLMPKSLTNTSAVFVAIQMGLEVGLSPMQAVQNIAVINGRPSVWGDSVLGLVRASGLLEDYSEVGIGEWPKDEFKFVCTAKRKGQTAPIIGEFSIAEAKLAGLWNGGAVWPKYPKRMLKMRARSFCLRDGFGDVLKGLRMAEEAMDYDMDMVETPSGSFVAKTEPPENPGAAAFDVMAGEYLSMPNAALDAFLVATAKANKTTVDALKERASRNFQEFWKAFEKWREKTGGPKPEGPDTHPWTRDNWIKLRVAGYADFVWKNIATFADSPADIQAEARSKWSSLYPNDVSPWDREATKEQPQAPTDPNPCPNQWDPPKPENCGECGMFDGCKDPRKEA